MTAQKSNKVKGYPNFSDSSEQLSASLSCVVLLRDDDLDDFVFSWGSFRSTMGIITIRVQDVAKSQVLMFVFLQSLFQNIK